MKVILIALMVSLAACGSRSVVQDGAVDAPIDVMVDTVSPDIFFADAYVCVLDPSIPAHPNGCCRQTGQACTQSCSLAEHCHANGCCQYVGP